MTPLPSPPFARLYFEAGASEAAQELWHTLTQRYGQSSPEEADAHIALGGDGLMLQVLHHHLPLQKPTYGIHCGTVGFLMNQLPDDLLTHLKDAQTTRIYLLKMTATTASGITVVAHAINEISLLRQSRQAAKIEVSTEGIVRIPELICDGILLCTSAGSTAYNLSINGPILPIGSRLLGLTPISPFRPRRWRGAILPDSVEVIWRIMESDKRPVSASADLAEVENVVSVHVCQDTSLFVTLLFDPNHNLEERILNEQFLP